MNVPVQPEVAVAIPARDEADRIVVCLQALATQTRVPNAVLVLANNCTDRTAGLARRLAPGLPYDLRVIRHTFPPEDANAGAARSRAMDLAADLAGDAGILLTTDADTIVPGNWVERNLAALAHGADAVCGRIDVDPVEAIFIPAHLHADDALECELLALLDELGARIDPDPADPWPRHTEEAGASLGVTVAAFRRVGGIPALPSGEDRAFIAALRRIDAVVRHDPAIRVSVSGRLDGRTPGGMADTIRRRMRQQDEFTDTMVEPAADAFRRVDFRRRVRRAWQRRTDGYGADATLAADLGVRLTELQRELAAPCFGAAWAALEAGSPLLVRRRVRFAELPNQIAYARLLLEQQRRSTLQPLLDDLLLDLPHGSDS